MQLIISILYNQPMPVNLITAGSSIKVLPNKTVDSHSLCFILNANLTPSLNRNKNIGENIYSCGKMYIPLYVEEYFVETLHPK